jgi:hypothetical protein
MIERVDLGPPTRAQHEQARDAVHRIFERLAAEGRPEDEIVAYLSGMTDRFALEYAESG